MARGLLILWALALVGAPGLRAGEQGEQARALREMDLRRDVLDLKYARFISFLSDERPCCFKYDPFVIPSSIPAELLPDERVRTRPSALLAALARRVAFGFRAAFDIVGVMGFDGALRAVVQDRATLATNLFPEGAMIPGIQVDAVFNEETQQIRIVYGIIEFSEVHPALVVVRFGTYYDNEPGNIVWRTENFYIGSELPF
ncbi:hypothetical protein IIA16_03475 [bacterium]|nr:hypothetical protein [bacterium]